MIEFKYFPSRECIMTQQSPEEQYIISLFEDLRYLNGYTANLQYIYNNSVHSLSSSNSNNSSLHFCDENTLRNLYYLFISNNPQEKITVLGTIHPLFHQSNVVKSRYNNNLLIKDNYIRMKLNGLGADPNTIYHFFVSPPEINDNNYYIMLPDQICRYPNIPIYPIVNQDMNNQEIYSCLADKTSFINNLMRIKLYYEQNKENLQFYNFYNQ